MDAILWGKLRRLNIGRQNECGTVGRAVASNTQNPRFESSHLHLLGI